MGGVITSKRAALPRDDDITLSLIQNEAMMLTDTYSRNCLSHLRPPWTERIPWYPKNMRPYTRRELTGDALVHAIGLVLTAIAIAYTLSLLQHSEEPPALYVSMGVYLSSLFCMFVCSSYYNIGMGHYG